MEWINGRSLKSYKNTTKNQEINYKYNKDGIREEKNFNGEITKYYLENNHIIYEQRGNDTIYYLYDLTGLIGLRYQEENYYYIKNLQGDIIGMLDKNYNRIVSYEYDSWGKLLSIKDEQENEITDETNIGIINPFRYREYYYDTETGLYYLNSRYYNPVWGRFLNADGILGANEDIHSYNLYAYTSNNPVFLIDPNGYGLFNCMKSIYNAVTKSVGRLIHNTIGRVISINFVTSKDKKLNSNKPAPYIQTSGGVKVNTTTTVFGRSDSLIKINTGSSNGIEVSGVGSVSLNVSEDSFEFNAQSNTLWGTTTNFSFGFNGEAYVSASRGIKTDNIETSLYGKIEVDNKVTGFVVVAVAVGAAYSAVQGVEAAITAVASTFAR